ncbi:Hypothetical protein A7982_03920 [Minicystis rosea]|nr:Hypothetical protein A7982_03920 [Minicystis rosea]
MKRASRMWSRRSALNASCDTPERSKASMIVDHSLATSTRLHARPLPARAAAGRGSGLVAAGHGRDSAPPDRDKSAGCMMSFEIVAADLATLVAFCERGDEQRRTMPRRRSISMNHELTRGFDQAMGSAPSAHRIAKDEHTISARQRCIASSQELEHGSERIRQISIQPALRLLPPRHTLLRAHSVDPALLGKHPHTGHACRERPVFGIHGGHGGLAREAIDHLAQLLPACNAGNGQGEAIRLPDTRLRVVELVFIILPRCRDPEHGVRRVLSPRLQRRRKGPSAGLGALDPFDVGGQQSARGHVIGTRSSRDVWCSSKLLRSITRIHAREPGEAAPRIVAPRRGDEPARAEGIPRRSRIGVPGDRGAGSAQRGARRSQHASEQERGRHAVSLYAATAPRQPRFNWIAASSLVHDRSSVGKACEVPVSGASRADSATGVEEEPGEARRRSSATRARSARRSRSPASSSAPTTRPTARRSSSSHGWLRSRASSRTPRSSSARRSRSRRSTATLTRRVMTMCARPSSPCWSSRARPTRRKSCARMMTRRSRGSTPPRQPRPPRPSRLPCPPRLPCPSRLRRLPRQRRRRIPSVPGTPTRRNEPYPPGRRPGGARANSPGDSIRSRHRQRHLARAAPAHLRPLLARALRTPCSRGAPRRALCEHPWACSLGSRSSASRSRTSPSRWQSSAPI